MKREGRQHGLVATSASPWITRQDRSRHMEKQQPTAGIFTRVSQKPTNHSKYTSRCPRPRCACCHTFPVGKAKDKTKGTHKLRSSDVVTNYRLVTWRVVDDFRPGFKLSGFSASGILDHLDYFEEDPQIYDDDDDDQYEGESYGSTHHQPEIELMIEHPNPNPNPNPPIEEIHDHSPSPSDEDGDDEISYCNVGIVWEQVDEDEDEEEGWCLVQEL